MKEQIKELRVKIDGLSQLVKTLKTKKTQVDIALKTKQETIDDFLNRVESEKLGVEIIEQSEQIKKCHDSLILAKAWLGKVLGEIGEPTPYANDGKRKTVEDIEPTADKANMNLQSSEMPLKGPAMINWSEKSHIEKVDWLRQEINKVLVETQSKLNFIKQQKISYDSLNYIELYQKNIYTYLSEARFWLGFELERIRESSTHNI